MFACFDGRDLGDVGLCDQAAFVEQSQNGDLSCLVEHIPVAGEQQSYVPGRFKTQVFGFGTGFEGNRGHDFFGELSVIDQRPRTATAYALGETVCLALASWDLMAVLEREPVLAMNMLKELAGRLRAADAQLRH